MAEVLVDGGARTYRSLTSDLDLDSVDVCSEGQRTDYPNQLARTRTDASVAARHFYRTGELAATLSWLTDPA